MPLPPRQPAVTLTFDLQNLTRSSAGAVEYPLSVFIKTVQSVQEISCTVTVSVRTNERTNGRTRRTESPKTYTKLDGKYSERVQFPAKEIAEFFDRYFHIPLPIVTKHELGLPFPLGTFHKIWYKSVHNLFSYCGHRHTDTHTNRRW